MTEQTTINSEDLSAKSNALTLELMLANLKAAVANYPSYHKSRHWNRFSENYAEVVADTAVWSDFRRNGLTAGFDSSVLVTETPPTKILDPQTSARYYDMYRDLCCLIGSDFVRGYSENEIGTPEHVEVDSLKVTITDLRLIYNAWRISEEFSDRREESLVIVDIGGGYGGLALKLKKLFPNSKILLFDLPEVNAVQTYYLSQAEPKATVAGFRDLQERGLEMLVKEDWHYVILPGWTISDLPSNSVDLFINTRSMMEMYRTAINEYFVAIHRATKHAGKFYCVNRYTNKAAGELIRIKDFPFDERWRCIVSQPCWNQPWIHELMVERLKEAAAIPLSKLLSDLPPVTLGDLKGYSPDIRRRLATFVFGDHPNINPGLRWTFPNWKHRAERFLVRKIKANKKLYKFLRWLIGRSERVL